MSKGRHRSRGAGRSKKTVGDEIFERFDIVHPNCAAIDIASETHYASVPDDRVGPNEESVRTFGCFTSDLEEMADWFEACRITHVAMESTGVYWVPAYQVLTARGFDVALVDAHHASNVPGRKTDVWDSRWLRKLHTFGLLRGCFIPPADVVEMRTYVRHRASLVESCSQQVLRIQKALEQMNLQLHKVLSDIVGVSGLRILRAILAGERDAHKLAALCHKLVKADSETVVKSLNGHYRPEHLFTLKQALSTYEFLHQQMQDCDEQIHQCMARFRDPNDSGSATSASDEPVESPTRVRRKNEPYFDMASELKRILGVDLTRITGISALTAMIVLSECGPDLSSFKSERHFSSWLGLSPNHRITGGRIRSNRTRNVDNRLASALRVAAQSLHRSQTALGAFLRRIASRHGMPKAITATAHKLACIIYNMITRGEEYVVQGRDEYEKQYAQRRLHALQKQARSFGLTLVCTATGAVVS